MNENTQGHQKSVNVLQEEGSHDNHWWDREIYLNFQ